ncbi:Ig-like domain-containing protein [Trichlorobacter ammonificans]|uniref:DUF4082 domain-containing protein n=1 Tax=Trichlorobacter ammonificans TaxID=2916410 RepID=A0ABN8HEX2_9BACT|nr:Ig-like domain-containing protein [Trichlorobacter ammonificans]CAH2031411.1 exported protein of unknown function [Trichlorobacter ammonificans]
MKPNVLKQKLLTYLLTLSCLVLTAIPSHAGVIFEESFDAQADWNVNNIYKTECAGTCTTAPANWSNYRTVPGTSALTNPTGSIRKLPGSLPDRSGSGKAYIVYNQSVAGVNWPGDSTLVKVLPQDYPELYVRLWIKTQANWKTVANAQSKVFRTYHWDRSGNLFQFFSSGTVNPAYIWDWSTNGSNNASYMDAYRCDPQETNYYCTAGGVPSYQLNDYFYAWGSGGATTKYADGQWHRYDFHLKMNDIGKNNGVMEWWWDGVLMESRTDVQWKGASGSSASIGWNTVSIGGNSNNTFSGSTPADQWYAIDDLVVSTTPIPADYAIGGGSSSTADTTAPTVSLAAPANNASVSGSVSLTANAADNVGVSKVEFYLDGALLATDNSAPYQFSWDSSSAAAGSHTVMAKAFDAAGNVGQSATVTVNVVRDTTPPTVSLTSPANNATVSGSVSLTASATDNVGVSRVEFYSNGTLLSASNQAPYNYTWSPAAGSYSLSAKAFDAAGNVGQSSTVSVTVASAPAADTTAPTVAITSPANNAVVNGTVQNTVAVADNVGVTKVEYYVNGGLDYSSTTAPFSYSVATTVAHNGTYTMYAKAYDAAGNVKQSSTITFTIKNGTTTADTTVPTVALTAPAANATLSGRVNVTASASDNVGVSKVEFYLNGALKSTATAAPYSFAWDTTTVADGSHTLLVKASDAAGNTAQSSVSVTVKNAVQAASSLWSAGDLPSIIDVGPDSPVELGVKFRSDVAGYITGIRFYKAAANTGTHVANLWSSSGRRLATATFSNETASGWQQVTFATPVAISANTVYVASYHTRTGHYSGSLNFFTGKAQISAPLRALADGESGSNGVYAYGSAGSFPRNSWKGSNYWVDVVFKAK